MPKIASKTLTRQCAICAKQIRIILYSNRTYRGGHYFFKIKNKKGKMIEYWECPRCYWKGSSPPLSKRNAQRSKRG